MFVCFIRSIILYLILIVTIRLMGKRQIGELEPSEFVVAMLIADLASVPMQDLGIPLLSGVIPILTVLALELILSSLSYHSILFRKALCGRPVILMEKGSILYENLKKTRITPDELTELLREKGILDLSCVECAICFQNGEISAFPASANQPVTLQDMELPSRSQELPVTLISNGKLLTHNLQLTGRTMFWLDKELRARGMQRKDVYLMTVDPSGKIYLSAKDVSS